MPADNPASRHGSRLTRRLSRISPNQLLVILAIIIFFAEICTMLVLDQLPQLSGWSGALLDSCLLLLLLSPAYFFLYRPFWQEHQRAEAEIRRLSRQLIRTEEATRKALARDLHDEFGQLLGALQLGIATLNNSLPADQEPLTVQCQRLSGITAQLGAHIRDVTAQLRPTMLDSLGLVPTMRWHLGQYQLRHPDIQLIMENMEEEIDLSQEASLALYRVFQESLNNVAKHARANQVRIGLRQHAGQATLQIEDNGAGFEQTARRETGDSLPRGIGIPGMRERIADLGGVLLIKSCPGEGTLVQAKLPLPREASE